MICSKCQENIPDGEQMNYRGMILCEDCYVDAVSLPKACDVAAVHSAKLTRKLAGQEGTNGLTKLQIPAPINKVATMTDTAAIKRLLLIVNPPC